MFDMFKVRFAVFYRGLIPLRFFATILSDTGHLFGFDCFPETAPKSGEVTSSSTGSAPGTNGI